MVLVDTSVWIRFLRGAEPYATRLDDLLGRDEVVGHEMVYGELLIGDRGARRELLAAYALMQQATTVPHTEVAQFARDRRLPGRGIGWVDVHLLASALIAGHGLWTADERLVAAAKSVGAAYHQDSW